MAYIPIKIRHGGNGRSYCDNPVEFLEQPELKVLSRAEIANLAEVDVSTIRGWVTRISPKHPQGYSSIKPIRKLQTYLASYGSVKPPIGQSTQTQKDEKFTEIVLSVDGQPIGKLILFKEIKFS